jgi:predicted nucleic acid-binding Zn ribbon protein
MPSSPAPACFICNKPLVFYHAQQRSVCDRPQCQWNYARIPPHQLCVVCGRPLAMSEFAAKTCETAECRRFNFAEKLKREREERAILLEKARLLRDQQAAQARDLRDQQAGAAGVAKPEKYALVVIPSFTAPVTNLPARRRRAFRDHLKELIREASISRATRQAQPEKTSGAPNAMQTVIGQACATCKGSCCRNGGDKAYLGEATIRRFIEAHPELRPRDVLAEYLRRISNKTYQHSCIYHSTQGCGLTAEMRSDTCNFFFCEGLKEFQLDHRETTGPIRVFLASESDGVIHTTAFIEADDGNAPGA